MSFNFSAGVFCSRTGNPGLVSWAREMLGECQHLPGVGSLHKKSCQALGPRVMVAAPHSYRDSPGEHKQPGAPWPEWANNVAHQPGRFTPQFEQERTSLKEEHSTVRVQWERDTWGRDSYNPVTGQHSVTICTSQGHFCSLKSDLQLLPSAGLSGDISHGQDRWCKVAWWNSDWSQTSAHHPDVMTR